MHRLCARNEDNRQGRMDNLKNLSREIKRFVFITEIYRTEEQITEKPGE